MIPPAVIRGSRLAYGSWKIICIRRRRRRSSAPLTSVTSTPSKTIRPAGRRVEPDDRPAGRALAAARLADQAERLAAAQRERDAVDRPHVADVALDG